MDSKFESELRIAPKLVLALIMVLGSLVYPVTEMLNYQWQVVSQAISLFLFISLLVSIGWVIVDRWQLVGRWFTVLTLAIAIHVGSSWLQLPGSFALAVVPIVFALLLLGVVAAAITTVGESLIILLLANFTTIEPNPSSAIVALLAIWAIFIALAAGHRKVQQLSIRLFAYFQQAQNLLEDARNHRAELVQALDELAYANHQLALMNKRVTELRIVAEEAQKSKTRFVARVSHEFRTPLNMIIGLVDLMAERPEIYDTALSPRMRNALRIVNRNCQHLSDMVNDVLDLSRIETESMVLHKERVAISDIVEVAIDAVRPLLENKQIALSVQIPEDIPLIYCDRTRIEQVVLNLVSNSARYTDKGHITVVAEQRGQHVLVSIADTGHGISPKDLDRIFEPFAQGTSDLSRDKGGSGLGLSISKQFIELHNGRMWVESELGVGTTFTFELPISSPIDPISRPGHQIQESWVWRERRSRSELPEIQYNPRVVICDETGDLSAMLARYSGEIDFVNTRGGNEAIEALRQSPANAVLLNVTALENFLPLVELLKREATGTPIIGCSVPRYLDYAKSLGLLGQLIKPVTRGDLDRALRILNRPIRRVLIVDDDSEVLGLFSQMLRVYNESLEIETAENGEEALDRLRRNAPDLMLLDLVMPEMDGWQVLEKMAHDDEIPRVPTYLVSAQDPSDRPPRSSFMMVATEDGLSLSQLLRCSLELSSLLLQPEGLPDPASG
jgi:signal transduction histidine kinase/CheY-like chemotaxis protein